MKKAVHQLQTTTVCGIQPDMSFMISMRGADPWRNNNSPSNWIRKILNILEIRRGIRKRSPEPGIPDGGPAKPQ